MATAPLIVVVGPTASGKTVLAVDLAERLAGEIICADSRTVYKGPDIGTAKPSAAERVRAPHHLLDVVAPDESFTAADFKRLANRAIEDIDSRGKIPIMAGGSGLYIDSVLYDYQFAPLGAARDNRNPRHLSAEVPAIKNRLRENTLVIGLCIPKEVLAQRISERVERMLGDGLAAEAADLQSKYPGSKVLDAPGYKAFSKYLEGKISLDEAKALFVRNDLQLAKRQMAWFRRNNSIHWVDNREEVVDLATTFLSKKSD